MHARYFSDDGEISTRRFLLCWANALYSLWLIVAFANMDTAAVECIHAAIRRIHVMGAMTNSPAMEWLSLQYVLMLVRQAGDNTWSINKDSDDEDTDSDGSSDAARETDEEDVEAATAPRGGPQRAWMRKWLMEKGNGNSGGNSGEKSSQWAGIWDEYRKVKAAGGAVWNQLVQEGQWMTTTLKHGGTLPTNASSHRTGITMADEFAAGADAAGAHGRIIPFEPVHGLSRLRKLLKDTRQTAAESMQRVREEALESEEHLTSVQLAKHADFVRQSPQGFTGSTMPTDNDAPLWTEWVQCQPPAAGLAKAILQRATSSQLDALAGAWNEAHEFWKTNPFDAYSPDDERWLDTRTLCKRARMCLCHKPDLVHRLTKLAQGLRRQAPPKSYLRSLLSAAELVVSVSDGDMTRWFHLPWVNLVHFDAVCLPLEVDTVEMNRLNFGQHLLHLVGTMMPKPMKLQEICEDKWWGMGKWWQKLEGLDKLATWTAILNRQIRQTAPASLWASVVGPHVFSLIWHCVW